VVGRDDWLFYAGEKTMEDLVGRERLSDAELAAWLRTVEGRRAWWREHGADYLFVIAPNKSTVYPEKLPAFLQRQRRPGKLDQLLDYFTANKVNAPFVDLRGPLNAAKGTFPQLYWPTDSHWSAEGLVVSSDAIMTALKLMGVPQRPRDERTWLRSERVLREGDCIDLLALQRRWPLEHITQLRLIAPPDGRITKTPLADMAVWDAVSAAEKPLAFERDSGVGRAVMFCDSFFRAGGLARDAPAQSPLVLNFQRFISIWPWRAAQNLASYDLVAAVAQLERPTIVIEQWTERYLRTPPPDDPEFQRAREAAIAAAKASAAPAPAANGAR
jgi:hypothetical protein